MRATKLILQPRGISGKPGFTLVETLAAMGIMVTFLTAALVAFNSTQSLSDNTQQSAAALQAAEAKLEQMRAMDFSGLLTWYTTTGPDAEDFDNDGNTSEITTINDRFTLYDSYGNKYGMGNIVLTDLYDDVPDADNDNWILATDSAWSTGKSGHSSVVFDNKIWVLGGWGGSVLNEVWSSEDGITWATSTENAWSTGGRIEHSSVVFDNKIWVLGGLVAAGPPYVNEVWYSEDGITWATSTENAWSTGGRIDHSSVVFDNKIWVLGGWRSGSVLNEVWYSEDGATWTLATDSAWSTGGRATHTSVVFDNKIWVLGGYAGVAPKNEVWYSEDGITWATSTENAWSTGGKSVHSSVVLDGRMWVLGGMADNEVWSSTDGTVWTQATDAIANFDEISNAASVAYGGKIWVLGGYYGGAVTDDAWWSYGADRMYQVDITVSYRQRNGRIVGEDNGAGGGTALDGLINGTEDVDGNGILDSPVHITGLIANRGYPAQIYMGRE